MIYWLGQVEYQRAWQLQRELAVLRAERVVEDILLLLEHPPTITLGRGAKEEHILASRETLRERGIAIHAIDRGGDVTFHGRGQLVGYPIFHLSDHKKDIHWFIRQIEEALIQALQAFGVRAQRFPPHTGVWVGAEKVAAIGIKVSRWVSTHGFALNVNTDLRDFEVIVPCGIQHYGITSLQRVLQRAISVEQALLPVAGAFYACFGTSCMQAGRVGFMDRLSAASRDILSRGNVIYVQEGAMKSAKKAP
jgi:lipoyl(octanoyl) transferase